MPRPSWKGYLKLSLVSCGVALYNASSSSERVSFNTLNRKTGNRLKQNLVDSVSGEPVDTADRVNGYQVAKGVLDFNDDRRDRITSFGLGRLAREHQLGRESWSDIERAARSRGQP